MADDADHATAFEQARVDRSIAAARVPIPVGNPGICENCGEDMPRLVGGLCAPCREPKKGYRRAG